MPIDLATLGRRLRDARLNCGLSQDDSAKALGLSRTAIVHIEAGNRMTTSVEIAELARLYKRPVADLYAGSTDKEPDAVLALLRAIPNFTERTEVKDEVARHLQICAIGGELEALLQIQRRAMLPEYNLASPRNVMDAVEQGSFVAAEERRRLSLGHNPIRDMSDLLTSQGIWASGALLPDEISGLFLRHSSIGTVILVNYDHVRVRKRFSYAHEYCHALVDRSTEPKISSYANRQELIEVRSNSFAASLLLPSGGVESFLSVRDKGMPARMEQVVYDPSSDSSGQSVFAHRRVAPGSQRITYHDVATLAHYFGASYPAAAYRLKGLGKINQDELEHLLKLQESGLEFLKLLRMAGDQQGKDTPNQGDRELVGQVASLTVEAYRRKQIPKNRLLEICKLLEVAGKDLLRLAEIA